MNNAKMWLVVSPTVGVPLFLGAVAVGSFAVHVSVLTNTSWVADFLSGQPLGTGDMAASMVVPEADTDTAKASYARPLADGSHEITIVLEDGTAVKAIVQPNEVMAAAGAPPGYLATE